MIEMNNLKNEKMTLEIVKNELENNDVKLVTPDSEYYWDDESIVFEYQDRHILVYVGEDELSYFLYTRELEDEDDVEEGEEPEMMNTTFHFGNSFSVEGMLRDLGLL